MLTTNGIDLSTQEFWLLTARGYFEKSQRARGAYRQRCEWAVWVCLLWWAEAQPC